MNESHLAEVTAKKHVNMLKLDAIPQYFVNVIAGGDVARGLLEITC